MRKCLLLASLIALFSLSLACSPQADPRYAGWNRYTDEADGYIVLVPQPWEATDDTRPGIRGTRFNPTVTYSGDMAGFVHFSVLIFDPLPAGDTPDARAEAAVRALVAGNWQDVTMKTATGTVAGVSTAVFELTGTPLYSGYTLQGRTDVLEFEGKLYVLFAGATTNSWPELVETFDLIRNGFRLK